MSVAEQSHGAPRTPVGLRVAYGGTEHPAREIARGAAYELFSTEQLAGFERDPRPDSPYPWHRFAHASEVEVAPDQRLGGETDLDAPLAAPLHRTRTWADVHRLSQRPADAADPVLARVRDSAVIRRGTAMIKVLSPRQLAGHLRGWLPYGFCHREYDVAHLRTPEDLSLLRTDPDAGHDVPEVAYALRWRAVDPLDYEVPSAGTHGGLARMPPHDRVGPPVLGTGFTPSGRHLIPEFVTRDFADLPMPANAALLAYAPGGTEVVLYTYRPEQRGWLRMAGPRWRHLLAGVPGVAPDQEYVQVGDARSTLLVGTYQGQEYEAVADPPGEFRVLAVSRAARYPVDSLRRRARYVTWRGAACAVLGEEAGWLRVRLCRPDPESVAALGAQCYERGVYESWAPAAEVGDDRLLDLPYAL